MKTKHTGFTLIELVVVIVILGILAVTAAPRFLNLSSDARIASLEGLEGALKSANSLVYSQAAIDGIEGNPSGAISVYGEQVSVIYGYTNTAFTDIEKVLDAELTLITNPTDTVDQGYAVFAAPATTAGLTFAPAGIEIFSNCELNYRFDSEDQPVYTLALSGC